MFLKPKDFATAINLKYTTLRQHISRGKVFKSGDFIDTEFTANKEYILEYTEGKGLDFDKMPNKTTTATKRIKDSKPSLNKVDGPKIEKPNHYNGVSMRKREADVIKTERDIELKNLQIEKLRGDLMPVEMVEKIMVINIQSVFREFESALENIASVYCEILGGSRDHLARMGEEMRVSLKDSINNAKGKSADEIETIIKEYALTRNRGERK